MSLNWSIRNCVKWEGLVCESEPSAMGGSVYAEGSSNDQRNEDRVTTHLAFMCQHIGLSEITEGNADEFCRRTKRIEEVYGDRVYLWTEDSEGELVGDWQDVTLDMIQRRIGLTTNANKMAAAEFNERYAESI